MPLYLAKPPSASTVMLKTRRFKGLRFSTKISESARAIRLALPVTLLPYSSMLPLPARMFLMFKKLASTSDKAT